MSDPIRNGTFSIVRNGRIEVCLAMLSTFYLERTGHPDVRDAVASCVEEFRDLFGERIFSVRVPSDRKIKKARGQKIVPREWFNDLPPTKEWEFYLHGGRDPVEASSLAIHGYGPRDYGLPNIGYLRIVMPVSGIEQGADEFSDLVVRFASKLKPLHGYGGIGIVQSAHRVVRSFHLGETRALAQRWNGLELDDPVGHTIYCVEGIKGVNWLTILDDRWISKIGGKEAFRRLPSDVFHVSDFGTGVVIRVGSSPQVELSTEDLLAYRMLSSLLEPVRVKIHGAFLGGGEGGFDRESSEQWLRRFDL